jgi:hypothetical protein
MPKQNAIPTPAGQQTILSSPLAEPTQAVGLQYENLSEAKNAPSGAGALALLTAAEAEYP